MSSPAEPRITLSKQIPLTARALDQLDAQVAANTEKSSNKAIVFSTASSSKMQDPSRNDPAMLLTASNKMVESDKTRSKFESEISKGKMRLPSAEFFFIFHCFFWVIPTRCVIYPAKIAIFAYADSHIKPHPRLTATPSHHNPPHLTTAHKTPPPQFL